MLSAQRAASIARQVCALVGYPVAAVTVLVIVQPPYSKENAQLRGVAGRPTGIPPFRQPASRQAASQAGLRDRHRLEWTSLET